MAIELNLRGKTAIITGGSAGIGLSIAQALFREQVNVVLVGRNQERLEQAKAAIAASHVSDAAIAVVAGNLADASTIEQSVSTALERFGAIHYLVNNAGAARSGKFLELKEQDYYEAWNVKLFGYIRMVQAVAPYLIEQRFGSIVNIAGAAARTPSPLFTTGGTTNAAVVNFTRGIAKELARHNVRINALSPGTTATDRTERLIEQRAAAQGVSVEAERERTLQSIPLGRIVDPGQLADLALFLLSDRASSITGGEFVVDGGQQPGI